MERPNRWSLTWRSTTYDSERRKWNYVPVVHVAQSSLCKMKRVKSDVILQMIAEGFIPLNDNIQEWLNESGK